MTAFHKLTPMLQSADLGRTIAFYTEVLGFRLVNVRPSEGPPVWCILARDAVEIMFMTNDHLGAPEMTGTLYFRVTDVRGWHADIAGRVEVLWGPEVFDYGMLEFAIKDCHGYTLSFGEPVGPDGGP